jgi:phosphoglycolate phosphatase
MADANASINTIIFDFDGTLHDCMSIYHPALLKAGEWLVSQGATPPAEVDEQRMRGFIGMTVPDMWESFMPGLDPMLQKQAADIIGEEMDKAMESGRARLFPGASAMLDAVAKRGYKLVLLSNCLTHYMETSRRIFELDRWFDGYFDSESHGGIPKQDIFPEIEQTFEPGFIIVGDRMNDLAVARKYKLPSIGCLYGYGSRDELADATCFADTCADIPLLIDRLIALS